MVVYITKLKIEQLWVKLYKYNCIYIFILMDFNKQTSSKLYCDFNLSCGTNNNILSGITGYSTVIMIGVLTDNIVYSTTCADEILETFKNNLIDDLQKFPELISHIRHSKTFKIHLHDDIQSMLSNKSSNNNNRTKQRSNSRTR